MHAFVSRKSLFWVLFCVRMSSSLHGSCSRFLLKICFVHALCHSDKSMKMINLIEQLNYYCLIGFKSYGVNACFRSQQVPEEFFFVCGIFLYTITVFTWPKLFRYRYGDQNPFFGYSFRTLLVKLIETFAWFGDLY